MTTRNRTLVFNQYRENKKAFRAGPIPKNKREDVQQKLLKSDELEMMENGDKKIMKLPPAWMSMIDEVHYDMAKIRNKMSELSEAHKKHLLPQFEMDESASHEQTIEVLTGLITKIFQEANTKIKRISDFKISQQEIGMKKNVQSTLALQLQEMSSQFRKLQKDYLTKLKSKQQKGKGFSIEEPEGPDETFTVTFTDAQLATVQASNVQVDQRTADIREIAKSVNELSSVFKDLSLLVIEQGTILDRIDFNIEQTSHHTEEAVKELRKADTHQKKYRNKLCILLLCLAVLIMIIAVVIRFIVKKS